MSSTTDLPVPDAAAQAASAELSALIGSRIAAAGGWLGFADFMEMALYAPRLGYYSGSTQIFGRAGDFVTAPEITPLFATAIANAIAPHLRPGDAILEIGGGSGALAGALLDALHRLDAPAIDYCILERSGGLRERQRQRLAKHPVRWLDDLPQPGFTGVILANEVLDALAVRCFRWLPGQVQELGVVRAGERFGWAARAADRGLREDVEALRRLAGGWPEDYRSEVCPGLRPWVASLAGVLRRGLLLFFDYGLAARELYHPARREGSLVCHYRHRAHDNPFFWPGLQDISAWVDFSAVAAAGAAAGLELVAYATQAHFLIANGVLEGETDKSPREQAQLASALRTLLLPGEMGEKFKLLALGRALDSSGLAVARDLRDRL